jgi:predicted acetyltransferase
MRIDAPTTAQIPALRALWKEAFADEDVFLDIFFSASFSPERCRCLTVQDQLAAALYWMDCSAGEAKLAYIYAVATAKAYRGRGLCRALLEDTHAVLKRMGYAGAILVP